MNNNQNQIYDLLDEPLRLNRFVCEISIDGVEIDSRVVRGFREERYSDSLCVDIASYENLDYDWLIDKAYNEKLGGKLTFKWLSPDLKTVKVAKYDLLWVSDIIYPEYKYGKDDVVSTKVAFKYADKHVEYFRSSDKDNKPISENDKEFFKNVPVNRYKCDWDAKPTGAKDKNEKTEISKNDKAYLKASVELFEDAKKRVKDKYSQYDNTEETMNGVLKSIDKAEEETKAHAYELGCTDEDMRNAKYKEPNGLYVERYNKRMEEYNKRNNNTKECIKKYHEREKYKNKKYESSFDFGDFNTALEWYKHHMIPNDKQYVKVEKFDEVDRDIEENVRTTVVVCSRQCGMTTHMVAWSLAKISTAMDCDVWYVAPNKNIIFNTLRHIPEEIRNLGFLYFDNTHFIIRNTQANSEIRFVTINRNIPDFFHNKELPDYVIYDGMALYNTLKLNDFMDCMDSKRKPNHPVKEICVSTPSKGGSVFNFIALTAPNVIRIPWYECKGCGGRHNCKPFENVTWLKKMKELLGEDNFNVELNCQIGRDDTAPKFKKERLPDDYGYVFFETDFPVKVF